MNNIQIIVAFLTILSTTPWCVKAQKAEIDIITTKKGIDVSKTLHGIFFEEINHSGEGGLYAEMVINRDFEYNTLPKGAIWAGNLLKTKDGWHERKWFSNSLHGWKLIAKGGAKGIIKQVDYQPLNSRNPHSMLLACSNPGQSFGVANTGFWGMCFKSGESYNLSFYARTNGNKKVEISVVLEDCDGFRQFVNPYNQIIEGDWKKYTCTFNLNTNVSNGRLSFYLNTPDSVWLDVVSLFPQKTYKNRLNGLRPDIVQMLADLKPSFMRFPGGAIVGGLNLDNRIQWKNSIGDIAGRQGTMNLWGYWTSNGLGFHEYLQLCEDIGADALWVCNPGFSDNYRKSEVAPPEDLHLYVQEAMDALEYALGPVSSKWGALRAANGHPAPFGLKYIEIGNEAARGQVYVNNYKQFYDEIKAKYSDIEIISNFDKVEGSNVEISDHHKYGSPEDFFKGSTRYDTINRMGPYIYVGEYAVREDIGEGNLTGALAEAAYLIGLERNSDIVIMSSYAPLIYNVNDIAWPVSMIAIDNCRVIGRSSYYVQKMFAHNQPDYTLQTFVRQPEGVKNQQIWALGGFDAALNEYVIKIVNRNSSRTIVTINLQGIEKTGGSATITTLWNSDPTAENSLDSPDDVVPEISEFNFTGTKFDFELNANSFTVLRIPSK